MSNEKDDELKIMSFLDGEMKEQVDLNKHKDLIKKMEKENYAIKNAIEEIDDMEDISFSILNQIRREETMSKSNYYTSLIPIALASIMFFSINRILSADFKIGTFIELITFVNNLVSILKSIISTNYLTFTIYQIFVIFAILIYLIKKGCLKNEI